jgi:acyl-CoA thioesterase-1
LRVKVIWLVLFSQLLVAQSNLLPSRDVLALEQRGLQLMESVGLLVPELWRGSAPLVENAKQAREALILAPGGMHSGLIYTYLSNARAFALLSDAVPKPYPFPEEGRKQMSEYRELLPKLEAHFTALLQQRETALRSPDRDNLRRYSEANSRLAPATSGRVVFLGDSITDAWRLNEYFPTRDFVNRGISGQITGEMLGRLKADVIDLKPAAVVILAGTNDLARGVPLEVIENNLTMIGDLLAHHRVKVIYSSVLPISDYHQAVNPTYARSKQRPPEQIVALNRWLESFCQNRGFTYLNYFPALADASGRLKAELAEDGLHPNATGYRLMTPLAAEAIQKTLTVTPPRPAKSR